MFINDTIDAGRAEVMRARVDVCVWRWTAAESADWRGSVAGLSRTHRTLAHRQRSANNCRSV